MNLFLALNMTCKKNMKLASDTMNIIDLNMVGAL